MRMGKVCNMEKILSVLENIKGYLPLIRLADLLDVAIVAYLVYKLLSLVKSTRAANILKGVAIFLAALWLSSKLNLRVVNYILSHMVEWGVLALILMDWARIGKQLVFLVAFLIFATLFRQLMLRLAERDRWYVALIALAVA